MKCTIVKEQLVEGLLKSVAVIPAKSGQAYLRTLWLKAKDDSLSVMATDANIEFTGKYPAQVAADRKRKKPAASLKTKIVVPAAG